MSEQETEQPQEEQPEAPGSVWVCPGCGARYPHPGKCSSQHEPLDTEEHELQPGDGPDYGAADAPAERPTEAPVTPEPAPVEDEQPAPVEQPAAKLTSDHLTNLRSALEDAFSRLDDLEQALKGA